MVLGLLPVGSMSVPFGPWSALCQLHVGSMSKEYEYMLTGTEILEPKIAKDVHGIQCNAAGGRGIEAMQVAVRDAKAID